MKNIFKFFAGAGLVFLMGLSPEIASGAQPCQVHQVTITIDSNGATNVQISVSSGFNNFYPQAVTQFPWTYAFTTSSQLPAQSQGIQFLATNLDLSSSGTITGTLTVDGNVVYSQTGASVGTNYFPGC
jgi:hypothetical protein